MHGTFASSLGRLTRALQMESYPKFHNEVGVSIVRIGCREFKCIGDKPPQDHPHIYLNMGDASEIGCPYCSTPSNRIRPCGELMPPGLFGSTTIDCSACMEKGKHPRDGRRNVCLRGRPPCGGDFSRQVIGLLLGL